MTNLIIIIILTLIIGLASAYVYKEKKKGKKCIGCPSSCTCCSKSGSSRGGCCDSQN